MSLPVPLVQLYRGGKPESAHSGSLHLVRGEEVLLSAGDVDSHAFYRSSSKPLQAMVVVTSGAAERFGLDAEEISLATGSHSGVARHAEVTQRILDKAEIDPSL
ncbi:MAG: asparaginase, partial [bacterium]|nr:asparaginase [bacterium]